MKSAEQWLDKLPPDILEHPLPLPARLEYGLKIIRQIQADALREARDILRGKSMTSMQPVKIWELSELIEAKAIKAEQGTP